MRALTESQVAPAVWAIIMVMSIFGALQLFVRYKQSSKHNYRNAAIGFALISVGIATYLMTDLALLAVPVEITGFALVVASGVVRFRR
jgi:hypothetical protein